MEQQSKYYAPLSRDKHPDLASSYQAAENLYGFLPSYLRSMARLPLAVQAYTKFCTELYDEVTLPAGFAHLISLQASIVSQCHYSIVHAAKTAADKGIPIEKIAAMPDFMHSPLFDESEREALSFAGRSATAPCPLDQPDFDRMGTIFSETEICEILFVVAHTGFHNRWNDSVGTELEPEATGFARQIEWLDTDA